MEIDSCIKRGNTAADYQRINTIIADSKVVNNNFFILHLQLAFSVHYHKFHGRGLHILRV